MSKERQAELEATKNTPTEEWHTTQLYLVSIGEHWSEIVPGGDVPATIAQRTSTIGNRHAHYEGSRSTTIKVECLGKMRNKYLNTKFWKDEY